MLDFLVEYVRRTVIRAFVLIGAGLDLSFLIAVAALGSDEDLGLAWPIVAVLLLAVLVVSGFFTFQEERRKTKPTVLVELSPSDTYAQKIGDELRTFPPARLEPVPGRKHLHLFAPFRIRVTNLQPEHDVRLIINELTWESRRMLGRPREIRRIPLISVDHQMKDEAELLVSKASKSRHIELLFEDTWDGTIGDVPKRSYVVLRPEVLGAPSAEVDVAKLVNPKGLSWHVGRHEISIRESVRTEEP